jgi:hypothetical protein
LVDLDIAHDFLAESQEDLWRFAWRPNYFDHLESYASETLRSRLERIMNWFARERQGSKVWFGHSFSHVDCVAFCFLDEVDAFFPALLAEFGPLSEHHRRVAARPEIARYIESNTRPIVFGMGCMGPKVDPRVSIKPGLVFRNPWAPPIDLEAVAGAQRRLTSR